MVATPSFYKEETPATEQRPNTPKQKQSPADEEVDGKAMKLAEALQKFAGVSFDLEAAAKTLAPIAEVLDVFDVLTIAKLLLMYGGVLSVNAPDQIVQKWGEYLACWDNTAAPELRKNGLVWYTVPTQEEANGVAMIFEKIASVRGINCTITAETRERDGEQVPTIYFDLLDKSQCVPDDGTGVEAAA